MASPFQPRRPRRRSIEQQMQIELIQLCDLFTPQCPELARVFHVPNGGGRSQAEAGILKGMGVRSGVPDLWLPVPSRTLWGLTLLVIEMKRPGGVVTKEQQDWLDVLQRSSAATQVCESVDHAWATICWHLDTPALFNQVCRTSTDQQLLQCFQGSYLWKEMFDQFLQAARKKRRNAYDAIADSRDRMSPANPSIICKGLP